MSRVALRAEAPRVAPAAADALRAVVDVHAAMLAEADLHGAARVLAAELKVALALDQVSVGMLDGASIRLVGQRDVEGSPSAAAMLEALDQRATVTWPEPPGTALPRITLAHRRLVDTPQGSVASVPLRRRGEPVGALTVSRRGPAPLSAVDIEALEYLACLAGPVLGLMQANERAPWQRARDALLHGGPSRLASWPVALGIVAVVILLLPLQASVGGRARLEGSVQRVLVAPADGFLAQAHVRPGDTVRAGQTLVEFAQQDLRLDRERWASQLEQYQNSRAAANARRDRAQLVINQSRADEAEAQIALVDMKLARAKVEAPFDGVVVRGDLSQQLGAPLQQGAELMTIAPRDGFRVMVEIDERDIAAVQVGAAGTATLSALPWDTLPLRVTRISPMANAVEGANVFEVEAQLLGPQAAALHPGLQGNAHIDIGREPLLWNGLRRVVVAVRLALWKWLG